VHEPSPDAHGARAEGLEPSVGTATVRVVLGPQAEAFGPEAIARLVSGRFRVASASDRVALRLTGPALPHRGPGEIVTDGLVPGSIQVPPDGQPIVTLADGPTTGGYPKIGVVRSTELGALAQLVPGEGSVRFIIG
jgi:allophanate hydrolase